MKKIKYSSFLRLFGIILFIYVLSKIDIFELITAFKEISAGYYLIAILFLVFGFFIRVLRWKMLVNSVGAEISFRGLAKILAKGVFFGIVTPGKLGEFWQAKYLAEDTGVTGGRAFYTTFMDRMSDLLVMGGVSFLGLMVIYWKFGGVQNWPFIALPLLLFMVLTYFFIRKKGIQRPLEILIKFFIPSFLKEKIDHFLNEFYQGFKGLNLNLSFRLLVFGILYYFFAAILVHYFITLALGITIPFWYLSLIVAMAWLIAAIPITVLGLGTREAAFIYFFSLFGMSASSAIALSLLALFCNVLIALPGAILFLKEK